MQSVMFKYIMQNNARFSRESNIERSYNAETVWYEQVDAH